MTSPPNDLVQLVGLIEEAHARAVWLGTVGGGIAAQLDAALNEARTLAAQDGRADEGRRPEDLSSANDG